MKQLKASTLRTIVVLAITVVIAVGYFSALGIGNLSDFGWDVISVICPLGFVETLLASKLFVPRAILSFIAVVLIIIAFGRVFCAWICPVPLLQHWFPGRKKKLLKQNEEIAAALPSATELELVTEESTSRKALSVAEGKPNKFKLDSRYIVLAGALLSTAIVGFPVFCLVCPVGLTFATVLFLMRLFVFGETTWTILIFPVILILELVVFRKWCKTICPLGALISLISGLNRTFRPAIDDSKCIKTSKGVNCSACSAVCDERIDIRNLNTSEAPLNNCTKCRNCSEICPAHAISFPFLKGKTKAEDAKNA